MGQKWLNAGNFVRFSLITPFREPKEAYQSFLAAGVGVQSWGPLPLSASHTYLSVTGSTVSVTPVLHLRPHEPSVAVEPDKRLLLPAGTLPMGGISHSLAFCILVPPVLQFQIASRGKSTLADIQHDLCDRGALLVQAELVGIPDQ